MKWTVYQLHQKAKNSFDFHETVDLNELTSLHSDIRRISPVEVKGTGVIESKQVAFDLTITGEMTLPCSRTLVDVNYPFAISTKELFVLHKTDDIEDEDVSVVEDDIIDLTPIVKEEILLEVPMQIFCDQTDVKVLHHRKGMTGRSFRKMHIKTELIRVWKA